MHFCRVAIQPFAGLDAVNSFVSGSCASAGLERAQGRVPVLLPAGLLGHPGSEEPSADIRVQSALSSARARERLGRTRPIQQSKVVDTVAELPELATVAKIENLHPALDVSDPFFLAVPECSMGHIKRQGMELRMDPRRVESGDEVAKVAEEKGACRTEVRQNVDEEFQATVILLLSVMTF